MYLSEFLLVALVNFLAVISPGPAFAVTIRNSLTYSRKTAIYTALGLGVGILVHVVNSILGLGLLISKSEAFFSIIKVVGAGYLIYLGYKSLTSKLGNRKNSKSFTQDKDLTRLAAFKMGFIINATNPKALVSFLAIFTLVVSPSTPLLVKGLYGIEMSLAEFTWFAAVGTIISHKFLKQKIGRFQLFAEKVMGIILIILGIKIVLF